MHQAGPALGEMSTLEERVRRLEDERAILDVLHTYGRALDEGLEDAFGQCWAEDAVLIWGSAHTARTFRSQSADFTAGRRSSRHSARTHTHRSACTDISCSHRRFKSTATARRCRVRSSATMKASTALWCAASVATSTYSSVAKTGAGTSPVGAPRSKAPCLHQHRHRSRRRQDSIRRPPHQWPHPDRLEPRHR